MLYIIITDQVGFQILEILEQTCHNFEWFIKSGKVVRCGMTTLDILDPPCQAKSGASHTLISVIP